VRKERKREERREEKRREEKRREEKRREEKKQCDTIFVVGARVCISRFEGSQAVSTRLSAKVFL
jgi:hypothetical protein